jgi:hypothetical protein
MLTSPAPASPPFVASPVVITFSLIPEPVSLHRHEPSPSPWQLPCFEQGSLDDLSLIDEHFPFRAPLPYIGTVGTPGLGFFLPSKTTVGERAVSR